MKTLASQKNNQDKKYWLLNMSVFKAFNLHMLKISYLRINKMILNTRNLKNRKDKLKRIWTIYKQTNIKIMNNKQ